MPNQQRCSIVTRRVLVTPEWARSKLLKNKNNRPIIHGHVQMLSEEMAGGRWVENGDTVRFAGDQLLDGQHRLLAVLASGVSVYMLVVYGLPASVFSSIDSGRLRSKSDTLHCVGEKSTNLLAAAICMIDRYKSGVLPSWRSYSNTEILKVLDKYPGIRESLSVGYKSRHLIAPSILVACHYLFSNLDIAAADKFVTDLMFGESLVRGDSVYLLRERLIQNQASKSKLRSVYIMALMIKAWNARRSGDTIGVLKYQAADPGREAYPVII